MKTQFLSREAIAKPRRAERRNPCGPMIFRWSLRRKDCGAPTFAIASRCSLLALVVAFVVTSASSLPARDAFEQNTRLGRGVNLLGWDAVWQNRARGQVKDVHFKLIREAGFQHVRINLHPSKVV